MTNQLPSKRRSLEILQMISILLRYHMKTHFNALFFVWESAFLLFTTWRTGSSYLRLRLQCKFAIIEENIVRLCTEGTQAQLCGFVRMARISVRRRSI